MQQSVFKTDTNTSATAHNIMGENASRRVITFYPPGADTVTLNPESGNIANGGIVLTPGMAPVTIHHDIHGEIVMREWYADYNLGGSAMSWIETLICPCKLEERGNGPVNIPASSARSLGRLKR